MTATSRIKRRLDRALGLFVSVPLFALPVLAQDKGLSVRERANVRAGIRVGKRALEAPTKATGIRIGHPLETGIRVGPNGNVGLRDFGGPIKD